MLRTFVPMIRPGLLFVTMFAAVTAAAQSSFYEKEPRVFDGGIVAGANFSQVDGDSYYGYHKVGFHAGGIVYVHFTEKFGASLELTYTQKGSRGESVVESPAIGTYVTKYYMDLNYAEIPVTLHVITHRLDIEAGASYARLINSKEWILTDQPVSIDQDKNWFRTSDVGMILGLGGKLYKGLHANIRFQYSLTSVRPPERIPVGYIYGNYGQFNNLFTLRLIYFF